MQGRRRRRSSALLVVLASRRLAVAAASSRTQRSTAGTLNIYGYGPGDDVAENRAAYAASQLNGTTINRPAGTSTIRSS